MIRSPSLSVWIAALICAGFVSCGAPIDGAVHTPFTVWVFDERLTLDGEDKPISNARVAFDPAGGGSRMTLTTEADGHVTFDGDFSQGGGSVTVLSDNHAFVTMLEASPESARARPNAFGKPAPDLVVVPVRLDSITEGGSAELRGNILGWKDPTNEVRVSASALPRLGGATALEPHYALRVPRDRSFFLLGHALKSFIDNDGNPVSSEVIRSFRIDLPARTDDELLDIDLATVAPLPTRSLHVRAEIPQTSNNPFGTGTRAYASVLSADSAVTPGVYASSTSTADGRAFNIDVTLAQTDIAPERPMTQAVLIAPDGSRSVRTEEGIVPDGTAWTDFMAPPTVPDPDMPRTAKDAIPLDGFPAGADLLVKVFAGRQLFWVLYGPPGGPHNKSFTIPYRDEISSTDVQVFAVSVVAQTDRVALPPRGAFYRRSATYRDIHIGKR